MPDNAEKPLWGVLGGSARGASHYRLGLPNQDAFAIWAAEDNKRAIVTVADGHGSALHFRSGIGSRIAVDRAMEVLRAVPSPVLEGSEPELCRSIVRSWNDAVAAHVAANPFQDSEWTELPRVDPDLIRAEVLANPTIAYGATLLCVLAGEEGIVFLQLGDGDILSVDEVGSVSKPVPGDSRLTGNQTTSLCQEDAADNFRVARLRTSCPVLILVATDGYSNSFQWASDFHQVGPDYVKLLRQQGARKLEADLSRILDVSSRKGSGDDITLAMIHRLQPGEPRQLPPDSSHHSRRWVGLSVVLAGVAFGISRLLPRAAPGWGLRLENGSTVPLNPGAILTASELHLPAPFAGPVLEVLRDPAPNGLRLRNRSALPWNARGATGPNALKPGDADTVHPGDVLLFGGIALRVTSR